MGRLSTLGSVAVVGPLADTLYTDWYSGALPYRVTVRDGLAERLPDGASLTHSEGVDRIALRAPDGRYVTARAQASPVALRATEPVPDTHLDAFDWGEGVLTLRTRAGGRYLSFAPTVRS